MNTTNTKIDWDTIKKRLIHNQSLFDESAAGDPGRRNNVFRQRAERLAERGRRAGSQHVRTPVLVFRLENERIGVELAHVVKVFPRVAITRVPGAMDYLLGVANLDGTIRSVINLRGLIGFSAAEQASGNVVVLRNRFTMFGVWVDSLEEVRRVELDKLTAIDDPSSSGTTQFVKGATDDRIIVLDTEALLEHVRRFRERLAATE